MILESFKSFNPNILFKLELIFRILLSCILGCIIGSERKNRDKDAGMRTHAIVCFGASVFMIISKYGFSDIENYDAARIAAQIVSGIGFLGAGIIFVRDKTVNGLTTAAGVWATAGVGMANGAGLYFIGIFSGVLILVVQVLLYNSKIFSLEPVKGVLHLGTTSDKYEELLNHVVNYTHSQKIKIGDIRISKRKNIIKIQLEILYPAGFDKKEFITTLVKDPLIEEISG